MANKGSLFDKLKRIQGLADERYNRRAKSVMDADMFNYMGMPTQDEKLWGESQGLRGRLSNLEKSLSKYSDAEQVPSVPGKYNVWNMVDGSGEVFIDPKTGKQLFSTGFGSKD